MLAAVKHDKENIPEPEGREHDLEQMAAILGLEGASGDRFVRALPFCCGDATAGAENEFQAEVRGSREHADLAQVIEGSNYYKNLIRQARAGDTPEYRVSDLEGFLKEKDGRAWENSWVRFPRHVLNSFANQVFNRDLKADKSNPGSGYRKDAADFVFDREGEPQVRIPVSYLLKLALAHTLGEENTLPVQVRVWGEKMLAHFSNDNSSPELFSFYPVKSETAGGIGGRLAAETLIRFLLTQALVAYAGDAFELEENGQQVNVYFSATPPGDQKQLNDMISDAFYRELFMSPCLSGWDRGEDKKEYMSLCHKVLSRSQINGVSRLKEAGIITSNLVVLPNTSNVSLANNGTHVSMGSAKLSGLMADPGSGLTPVHEKYAGDLAIKIWEHFLPLFATTYSAAPYRLDFEDFHPERVLGFMPHELSDVHLRMIWRRWKKKAKLKVMGKSLTPFGPVWLDRVISRIFRLKGDFIPDARLIDYFTSVMSTFQSPALDGDLESEDRLKQDLTEMGVFDARMPLYQLVRLRKFRQMGYSGFEHRYFSVFEDIRRDMGGAADLQLLITALTQKYIYSGRVNPGMIPDSPNVESERRQIFFCSAIGIPTFYVKARTPNRFLADILKTARKTRSSRRYPGYTRVVVKEYRRALISLIKKDAADLIEAFKLSAALTDLEKRIEHPETFAASGRLTRGILNHSRSRPMSVPGKAFNAMAENYYRQTLRENHISQGFDQLEKAFEKLDLWARYRDTAYGHAVEQILGREDLLRFLKTARREFTDRNLGPDRMKKLIYLIILVVGQDMQAWKSGT